MDTVYNISNMMGSYNRYLTTEGYETIYISNNMGSVELDLSNYEFIDNKLNIYFTNNLGSITIMLRGNARVSNKSMSVFGTSQDFNHNNNSDNMITIEGKNSLGSVKII